MWTVQKIERNQMNVQKAYNVDNVNLIFFSRSQRFFQ